MKQTSSTRIWSVWNIRLQRFMLLLSLSKISSKSTNFSSGPLIAIHISLDKFGSFFSNNSGPSSGIMISPQMLSLLAVMSIWCWSAWIFQGEKCTINIRFSQPCGQFTAEKVFKKFPGGGPPDLTLSRASKKQRLPSPNKHPVWNAVCHTEKQNVMQCMW